MISGFAQTFGQIVSKKVKALNNPNLVASRFIKTEKASLPVGARRSKRRLLKFPILATSSGALPLSYWRLVGAKTAKLGSVHVTNTLHTARTGMSIVVFRNCDRNVMISIHIPSSIRVTFAYREFIKSTGQPGARHDLQRGLLSVLLI